MRARFLAIGLALVALQLGCSRSSSSDETQQPMPSGTVLDQTFSIPVGEFSRVFLAGGTTYRAELEGTGIRLQVRPIDPGMQAPRVNELLPGASAGGSTIYTVQPYADGEYEFRSIGGDPGKPVNVRLVAQPRKPRE
jgi:hypothetical protein